MTATFRNMRVRGRMPANETGTIVLTSHAFAYNPPPPNWYTAAAKRQPSLRFFYASPATCARVYICFYALTGKVECQNFRGAQGDGCEASERFGTYEIVPLKIISVFMVKLHRFITG